MNTIPQMKWGHKPVLFQTEVQYSEADEGEPDWNGFSGEEFCCGSVLWVSCHKNRVPIPDDDKEMSEAFDIKDEDTWMADFARTVLLIYLDEDNGNIIVQQQVDTCSGSEDDGKMLRVAEFPWA